MAISQTTFDQRVSLIRSGKTVTAKTGNVRRKTKRSLRERCLNFPCFVAFGILAGGPSYAFVSTQPSMYWVIVEIQSVIALVG